MKAGTDIDIDTITRLEEPRDGHAETWQAVFTLPADAGLAQAETLEFSFSAVDDLDNTSDEISADNAFQIYRVICAPWMRPQVLQGYPCPRAK